MFWFMRLWHRLFPAPYHLETDPLLGNTLLTMTDDQYHLCQLLPLCRMMPLSFDRRFADLMKDYRPTHTMPWWQAATLRQQAHRYRKQLLPLIDAYTTDTMMRARLKAVCWEEAGDDGSSTSP